MTTPRTAKAGSLPFNGFPGTVLSPDDGMTTIDTNLLWEGFFFYPEGFSGERIVIGHGSSEWISANGFSATE